MNGFVKKIHILIIAAVLIGIAAFWLNPMSEDDTYAERPYITKQSTFRSGDQGSQVSLKWNKAYVQLTDGEVKKADGYEIQYSTQRSFPINKTVRIDKKAGDKSAVINLRTIDTKEKYKKNINKYYFRIRSFAAVNGRISYSKWDKAEQYRNIRLYMPVPISAADVKGKAVKLQWNPLASDTFDGYIVYGKRPDDNRWTKKKQLDGQNIKKYTDVTDFDQEYEYIVLAYRSLLTNDPAVWQNTSCIMAQKQAELQYRSKIKTDKLSLSAPKMSCTFDNDILMVSWDAVDNAEAYHIEVSKSPDFPESKTRKVDVYDAETRKTSMRFFEVQTRYYVRINASAADKGKVRYSSYSDVKTAKYDNRKYTIKFSGNGAAEGSMHKCIVHRDHDFTLPKNQFVRKGYTFVGWSTVKGKINETDMEDVRDVDWYNYQIGKEEYTDMSTVNNLADIGGEITLYACWKGSGAEAAADWAIAVANDDSFEYGLVNADHTKVQRKGGQSNCWYCFTNGPRVFNCNALCQAAYHHGAGYFTEWEAGSVQPGWWKSKGFTDLGKNYDPELIQKGDIICCHKASGYSHVMMAASDDSVPLGDRLIVNAKAWDKGICTENMLSKLDNYNYYYVLRLQE